MYFLVDAGIVYNLQAVGQHIMAKESTWEQVGRILIFIDGILILLSSILFLLEELSIYAGESLIPNIPGQYGFGAGIIGLTLIIQVIIGIVVGLVYIGHGTGRFRLDTAMANGIVFLILGILFGGLLTILGSIFYIIGALS